MLSLTLKSCGALNLLPAPVQLLMLSVPLTRAWEVLLVLLLVLLLALAVQLLALAAA